MLRAIEVVFSGVWHARFLANEVAGFGWGEAAHGVDALDERDAVEGAGAFGGDGGEFQPGDGVGIDWAGVHERRDDDAAAVAFPGGALVVDADDAVTARVGVEKSFGAVEGPACAIPAIDLHAGRVRMEGELVAG